MKKLETVFPQLKTFQKSDSCSLTWTDMDGDGDGDGRISNDEELNIALTEMKLEPLYRLSLHLKYLNKF